MTFWLAAASIAQAITFALVGWAAGEWVRAWIRRGQHGQDQGDLEWPERLLVAAAGAVLASIVLMVANIVSGGAIFGVAGVVPVLALTLLVVRRQSLVEFLRVPWSRIAPFLIVVALLWALPTILTGTAARSGDIPWHLGWSEQLLAGEPVPEGPAPTEVAENAYPWGFHAVLATLVRLVPGSDLFSALVALHFVLVACVPLAAACLARRIAARAGWAAAGAAALVGGFGWLLARDPDFITSPPRARYGADLVVASPNAVYGLFPPPLPRELGLVMLAASGVLLAGALGTGGRRRLVAAGIILGCAGLVSVPALVAGTAWTVAAVLLVQREGRGSAIARVLLPALVVFALWAGPVIRGMVEFGGLVNVSPSLGREWPVWTALSSWGLLVPLAVAGFVAARSLRSGGAIAGFGLATAALLAVAIARGVFDWPLAGNATVLHQGRIWPVAHLLGAAVAGVGLWAIALRLEAWRRFAGRLVASALLLVGAASPALASVGLTRVMQHNEGGYVYGAGDLNEDSFIQRAAARLDPDDVVLVRDDSREANALAFHLFSFSGARLAAYDDPRLQSNDLRIRFLDLARSWEERSAAGSFDVDYVVRPLAESRANGVLLTNGLEGDFAGRRWVLAPSTSSGAPGR